MPRPDPALLDSARYPFSTVIEPRFTDVDLHLHINNHSMLGMFQEARVRFHNLYAGLPASRPYGLIVAGLSIDFLRDGDYPHELRFWCGVSAIGRTSHTLQLMSQQRDTPVAVSSTVIIRTAGGKPIPNDGDFGAGLEKWRMIP